MRTRLWVCLSLLTVMSASISAQNMGRGKVDYGGEIVEVPCGLDTDSTNQILDFGEITAQSGDGLKKQFKVKLVDCELASKVKPGYSYRKANIAFYGEADEQDKSLLAVKGDARGLSIHLFRNESGGQKKISLGDSKNDYDIVEGDNTMHFMTEVKVNERKMRAGDFYATLQFVVSYF